ncbi:hypothetical protein D9M68_841570 [compost metagenome]
MVVATIQLFDRLIVAARLILRQRPTDGRFQCFKGRVGLLPRCRREEVDGRQLRKRFAQFAYLLGAGEGVIRSQLGLARLDLDAQLDVVLATVEQLDKALAMGIIDGQQKGRAIATQDVALNSFQRFPAGGVVGQQIDTIAQYRSATALEGTPGAHALCGISGRQGDDQG